MVITKRKWSLALTLLICWMGFASAITNAMAQDSDGDGLDDAIEIGLGTDPNDIDTDNDGLEDGLEYNYRLAYNARVVFYKSVQMVSADFFTLNPDNGSDGNADSDSDGLINGFEILNGLNPLNAADALQDLDGDGISNLEEMQYGTSLDNVDTDGDGLSDAFEIVLGTNPTHADTDGDGLEDGFEYEYRLAYNSRVVFYKHFQMVVADFFTLNPDDGSDGAEDSDSDGLINSLEILYGLSPLDPTDAQQDIDGDGLSNIDEIIQYGTSITGADSDGDGLSDGMEVGMGTDPKDADTDNDGMSDSFEFNYRLAYNSRVVFYKSYQMVAADIFTLNPLDANDGTDDTDADGISNITEINNGLNPLDAEDAMQDEDGDGLSNVFELENGLLMHDADTDGDGLLDGIEVQFGFDATDGADAALDNDGDGFSNLEEVLAGSDPVNSGVVPPLMILSFSSAVDNVALAGEAVQIQWNVQGAASVRITVSSQKQGIVLSVMDGLSGTGDLTVKPALSSVYRLEATGGAGSVFSEVNVVVNDREAAEIAPLWSENEFLNGGNGQRIKTSIVVTDEGVGYVGSFDGNLYRSSLNGDVSLFYQNAGVVLGKPLLTESSLVFGASSSADYDGRVCALSFDQTMTWVYDTQSSVIASPVLDDQSGILYAVTYQGVVTALEPNTGELIWEYSLPDEEVCATPVLTNNNTTLVIHTLSKTVYSLDLGSIAVNGDNAVNALANESAINWTVSFDQ